MVPQTPGFAASQQFSNDDALAATPQTPVSAASQLLSDDDAPHVTPGNPQTPVSAASQVLSDDDAPLVAPGNPLADNRSNRQKMLDCRFIAHQAKEGASGSSVEQSANSEDDRHLPDESYCTQGSYSDGDQEMYTASLTSQGARELGFGTPMHHRRRPARFESSYDDAVRLLARPGYEGPVCPQNHRLKRRTYKRSGRECDACKEVLEGRTGFQCLVCDFDLCRICSKARPAARIPAVRSPPLRAELGVSITSPFRGAVELHDPAAHAPLLRMVDAVMDVSDGSPSAPVKMHPFFLTFPGRRPGLGVNEQQFHAVARQPVADVPVASPSRFVRQPNRMRLRVSTPTFSSAPALLPMRPRQTRPQVSAPFSTSSPSVCNVAKNLFPDLLPPTLVDVSTQSPSHSLWFGVVTADATTQTSPRSRDVSAHSPSQSLLPGVVTDARTQTSPRSRDCSPETERLTLRQLREELQAFAKAFGF